MTTIEKFGLFIGNRWQHASGRTEMPVYNPADGREPAWVTDATADDVDRAVASAAPAVAGWWAAGPQALAAAVLRFADQVQQSAEELAKLKSITMGAKA